MTTDIEKKSEDTTTVRHLKNLISLMKRGALITASEVPDDTTFIASSFPGSISKDMADALEYAVSYSLHSKATHVHKKRGSGYVFIGVGRIQSETWKETVLGTDEDGRNSWVSVEVDMSRVAIYRSVDDFSLWVRPLDEFNDGRFEGDLKW